jgi:hypothetical protein
MGCGSSKAVEVASSSNAPEATPTQVNVKPASTTPTATPALGGKTKKKAGAITAAETEGGARVVSAEANADANLSVTGSALKKKKAASNPPKAKTEAIANEKKKKKKTEEEEEEEDDRVASARSAPSILERPSSRGGSAFEIQVSAERSVCVKERERERESDSYRQLQTVPDS